ncbi:MAG: DMT family transporter [Candidatus Eremiobacteraeota bacterium]|nr:DMT family transporter [Candidatus Eremiobacteraeota bacterium]
MYLVYILTAALAGAGLPVQLGLNNQVRIATGNPFTAAAISFSVGAVALALILIVLRPPMPAAAQLAGTPWWIWVGGGLLGVFYLTTGIVVGPKIGPAVLFALVVAGQTMNSIVIEHYGLFDFAKHQVTPLRAVGVLFLVGGVVLIRAF